MVAYHANCVLRLLLFLLLGGMAAQSRSLAAQGSAAGEEARDLEMNWAISDLPAMMTTPLTCNGLRAVRVALPARWARAGALCNST